MVKNSGSNRRGLVPRRKKCPCDLMMGCASAYITDGTARTSITRHSLMPMITSESSICHTNLGTTIHSCMFHILAWLLINACNNEDYAKIWTRPHLDTLYFPLTPTPFTVLVLFTIFCFCIWVPGMCPEPGWIDYPAPRSPADSFVMAGPIRHCLLRACVVPNKLFCFQALPKGTYRAGKRY